MFVSRFIARILEIGDGRQNIVAIRRSENNFYWVARQGLLTFFDRFLPPLGLFLTMHKDYPDLWVQTSRGTDLPELVIAARTGFGEKGSGEGCPARFQTWRPGFRNISIFMNQT